MGKDATTDSEFERTFPQSQKYPLTPITSTLSEREKYPRTKGSKDPIYNLHYCYAVGIENSAQATAVQSDVVGL